MASLTASPRAHFVIHNPVTRPGECILVTGANGYIASHLIDQLLAAGYRVRGTVRDLVKYEWVQKFFNQKYEVGVFELVLVDDMAADGAFDKAIKGRLSYRSLEERFANIAFRVSKGVSGVCHVAIGGFPVDLNVIDYTVNSTKKLLEVASREPLVRRFVYTSSITAAFNQSFDGLLTVDENTWNRQVVEMLATPTPGSNMSDPMTRALTLYGASKIIAEWEIYISNNGSMEVNSCMSGW